MNNNELIYLKSVPNVMPSRSCDTYMEEGMELELNKRDGSLSSKFLNFFLFSRGQNEDLNEMSKLLSREVDCETRDLFGFILEILKAEDWYKRYRAVVVRVQRNEDDYYHEVSKLKRAQNKLKKVHKEYSDVEWYIKNVQDNYTRKIDRINLQREVEQKKKAKTPCYVYIMKTHHNSRVKIGISNTPVKREATLRSDEDLYLYETKKFKRRSEAVLAEKQLHAKFDNYRSRGEWFDIPEHIIDNGIEEMLNN